MSASFTTGAVLFHNEINAAPLRALLGAIRQQLEGTSFR